MKKLDEKYAEIMTAMQKYEVLTASANLSSTHLLSRSSLDQNEEDLSKRFKTLEENEKKFRESVDSKVNELKEFEAKLLEKERLLETQQDDNSQILDRIEILKQELCEKSKESSSLLEMKLLAVKKEEQILEQKKKEMEQAMTNLNQELAYVENIKQSLLVQQDHLTKEQFDFKQQYSKKIEELINSHELAQEKLKAIIEKELIINEAIEAVNLKEEEVDNSWKSLKNTENIKEDYEKLVMMWEDMQSGFYDRERNLESREVMLRLKEDKHIALLNGDNEALISISREIDVKIEALRREEVEMKNMQEYIVTEKQGIESTAELMQNIHNELQVQQEEISLNKEKLQKDKLMVFEIYKKLDEESKIIAERENEVLRRMEDVINREELLQYKEQASIKSS